MKKSKLLCLELTVILSFTVFACTQKVNKTELSTLIVECQELRENDYSSQSWGNLDIYLAKAIEVRDNDSTTQVQVDSAKNELLTAKNSLVTVLSVVNLFKSSHFAILAKTVLTVIAGDKSAVEAAHTAYDALSGEVKTQLASEKMLLDSLLLKIEELDAQKALADAKTAKLTLIPKLSGYTEADYTDASWTIFSNAITADTNAINGFDTVEAVNGYTVTGNPDMLITKARELADAKTAKIALVPKLSDYTQADYTAASWTIFSNAIIADTNTINGFNTVEAVNGYTVTANPDMLITVIGVSTIAGFVEAINNDSYKCITLLSDLTSAENERALGIDSATAPESRELIIDGNNKSIDFAIVLHNGAVITIKNLNIEINEADKLYLFDTPEGNQRAALCVLTDADADLINLQITINDTVESDSAIYGIYINDFAAGAGINGSGVNNQGVSARNTSYAVWTSNLAVTEIKETVLSGRTALGIANFNLTAGYSGIDGSNTFNAASNTVLVIAEGGFLPGTPDKISDVEMTAEYFTAEFISFINSLKGSNTTVSGMPLISRVYCSVTENVMFEYKAGEYTFLKYNDVTGVRTATELNAAVNTYKHITLVNNTSDYLIDEPLHIIKKLTIEGSGAAIKMSKASALFTLIEYGAGDLREAYAVIGVKNSAVVTVNDLIIDGGGFDYQTGVCITEDSQVTLNNITIRNLCAENSLEKIAGWGIMVDGGTANVNDADISGFSKGGAYCFNGELSITGLTITGYGANPFGSQNGIWYFDGAMGEMSGAVIIENLTYTGGQRAASHGIYAESSAVTIDLTDITFIDTDIHYNLDIESQGRKIKVETTKGLDYIFTDYQSDGMTLELKTGEYNIGTRYTVTKDINLIGAGADSTRIIVNNYNAAYGIAFEGINAVVSGITFELAQFSGIQSRLIEFNNKDGNRDKRLTLTACDFIAAKGGAVVRGGGATVTDCNFYAINTALIDAAAMLNLLQFEFLAQGTVRNCNFYGTDLNANYPDNYNYGIYIVRGGNVETIEGCAFNNLIVGICVTDEWDLLEGSTYSTTITKERLDNYTADNTFSDNILDITASTAGIDYSRVSSRESLKNILALNNGRRNHISIAPGEYNLEAMLIEGEKNIEGENEGEVIINVTGSVSSAACIVFKNNTVLKNTEIRADGDFAAVKFTKISSDRDDRIDNVFLENVKVSGAGGLNLHGVNNATLNNVEIDVSSKRDCVALSVSNAKVTMMDCVIAHGAWGSIGIMYDTRPEKGYIQNFSEINFIDTNEISSLVYIEQYEASRSTVNGLIESGWKDLIAGTFKVYSLDLF